MRTNSVHRQCSPSRDRDRNEREHSSREKNTMTTEANKAIIRRIVEEIENRDNLALIDELLAPTFVNHTPAPGLPPDGEGIKQLLSLFRAAFPDGSMTIEDMIA